MITDRESALAEVKEIVRELDYPDKVVVNSAYGMLLGRIPDLTFDGCDVNLIYAGDGMVRDYSLALFECRNFIDVKRSNPDLYTPFTLHIADMLSSLLTISVGGRPYQIKRFYSNCLGEAETPCRLVSPEGTELLIALSGDTLAAAFKAIALSFATFVAYAQTLSQK